GALNSGRGRICLRRRPRGSNKSDVLAIDRKKAALAQPFEDSLTRAQSRLGLFAVRPGVEHRRQQQNTPRRRKRIGALAKEIAQRSDVMQFGGTFFGYAFVDL